jgi:hypothetical protein
VRSGYIILVLFESWKDHGAVVRGAQRGGSATRASSVQCVLHCCRSLSVEPCPAQPRPCLQRAGWRSVGKSGGYAKAGTTRTCAMWESRDEEGPPTVQGAPWEPPGDWSDHGA